MAKGSAFERRVCKDITDTFACFGVKVQDAYRSILSGGHKDSFGDITMTSALARMLPYAPECKFWKNANIHDLFLPWKNMSKMKSRFGGWWLQTVRGAQKCKRAPLCIFKGNKEVVLCAVPLNSLSKAEKVKLRCGPHITILAPVKIKGELHRVLVVPWSEFLKSKKRSWKERKKHGH